MKRFCSLLLALCLMLCLLTPSLAFAKKKAKDEPIPARYQPILDEWNATTAEELHLNILEYWRSVDTENPGHLIPKHWPLKIRFGGTTKELIADKKNWDLAIVSSKDVDLQSLIDKKLITIGPHYPFFFPDLYQWLLPDNVQSILPNDPNLTCYAYVYDYDATTNDATLLICKPNSITSNPPAPFNFAEAIMWKRSADTARAMQGMRLIPEEALWTENDFLAHNEEWDVGILRLKQGEKPDALDEAGLLYDFSQIEYFEARSSVKPNEYSVELSKGIFSPDGRMIGVPCVSEHKDGGDADIITMLIINNKSPYKERALTYSIHFMKSTEYYWQYLAGQNPAEISRDDMDW